MFRYQDDLLIGKQEDSYSASSSPEITAGIMAAAVELGNDVSTGPGRQSLGKY